MASSWLSAGLFLKLTKTALYAYDGFFFLELFEIGRLNFNPDLSRWEDLPSILTTPPGSLYKGYGKRKLTSFCLLACSRSLWQVHSFFGIRAYFGIPVYTEFQLRHPACGLNSYWILRLLIIDSLCWIS